MFYNDDDIETNKKKQVTVQDDKKEKKEDDNSAIEITQIKSHTSKKQSIHQFKQKYLKSSKQQKFIPNLRPLLNQYASNNTHHKHSNVHNQYAFSKDIFKHPQHLIYKY